MIKRELREPVAKFDIIPTDDRKNMKWIGDTLSFQFDYLYICDNNSSGNDVNTKSTIKWKYFSDKTFWSTTLANSNVGVKLQPDFVSPVHNYAGTAERI